MACITGVQNMHLIGVWKAMNIVIADEAINLGVMIYPDTIFAACYRSRLGIPYV